MRVLAIDLAAVWRRHVAICIPSGDLAKQDGDPIKRTLRQLLGYAPDYDGVFVAIDITPYWRTAEYSGYKANRTALDPGIHEMYRRLGKRIALPRHKGGDGLCWPVLHAEGFEADDVIATACKQLSGIDAQVTIVTSDKDLRQCLEPGVELLNVAAKTESDELWTHERVLAEMLITPAQVPLFLALAGDDSDGLPGVDGIGPKTAIKMLSNPSDDGQVITEPSQLRAEHCSARLWQALCDADPDVTLQYRLATLRLDVPIDAPKKLRAAEQRKIAADERHSEPSDDDAPDSDDGSSIVDTMGAPAASPSLDAALMAAQRMIRSVAKKGRMKIGDRGGYDYASSEDVIREARGVLLAAGVTAFREGWRVEYRPGQWKMPGTHKRPEPLTMDGAWVGVLRMRISHPASGEVRYAESEHPIIPTAGRALDKATSATLTTCLGYWYIGLLQIPRGDEVDAHDYDDRSQS